MPWFLNPRVYEQLPVWQNPELYWFLLKVAATAAFGRLLWRRGARGWALAGATWTFFVGLFVSVMLGLHAVSILGMRLLDRAPGTAFQYDFRLFSLLLLAGVLVPQGAACARAAAGLAVRDAWAWRRVRGAVLRLLAVAVPLIPLQFFGILLTAMGLVTLGALAATRPRKAAVAAEFPVLAERAA